MKISYHQVLPSREYGGAAEVAFRLAHSAAEKSPGNAHLWLPGPGRAWQKALAEELTPHSYQLPNIVTDSRATTALANLRTGWNWRQFRPGILHLHSAELYGGLQRGCGLSTLSSIVHIHLEQEAATIRWAFRRSPDLVVTCADFLVGNVQQYLTPPQQDRLRIVSVPNCIDTRQYHPGDSGKTAAKLAVDAPIDAPLALMLANLAPHKGQTTAIRAIAILKQQQIPVHLWIAGVDRDSSGDYPAELASLIGDLDVADRVKLLGYRTDGAQLLRAADAFLLPSQREGLPLSVLEAQASQVPVLAAPTAGIPEVIADGLTGYLIPADDAAGYAARLANILSQSELRDSIVQRAYRQVQQNHRVEIYCERVWALYEELLNDRRTRPGRRAALL